ncbi:hypothetical protein [Saccharopolyspora sp. NPDC049426]|uniref:hypothetical protein n=1 Tax=Saccharopolyspora sp. NPDC049426 TaxID=3155652 RepID=UPI00342FEED1
MPEFNASSVPDEPENDEQEPEPEEIAPRQKINAANFLGINPGFRAIDYVGMPQPKLDLITGMVPTVASQINDMVKSMTSVQHVISPVAQILEARAKQRQQLIRYLTSTHVANDWAQEFLARQVDMLSHLVDPEAIRNLARKSAPPNWQDLEDLSDYRALMEIAKLGIPVAWIPEAAILRALIDADHDDRSGVLFEHRHGVLQQAQQLVDDIDVDWLGEETALLARALESARAGHHEAAQALATNVLDTLLRKAHTEEKPRGYYARVRVAIEESHGDPIDLLRRNVPYWPVPTALANIKDVEDPRVYNRNHTAHRVSLQQYSGINSVIALAIATSVLCEIDDRPDLEEPDDEVG